MKMDYLEEDDFGLSGLTQEARNDPNVANFNLDYQFVEEDINLNSVISLEDDESEGRGEILYDNIRC